MKRELKSFFVVVDVWYERKRGIKGDFNISDVNNGKDGVIIYWNGEDLRKSIWWVGRLEVSGDRVWEIGVWGFLVGVGFIVVLFV